MENNILETVMTFAKTATPLSIIALLSVVIFQLIKGKSLLSMIRGTQQERTPKADENYENIRLLVAQNDTLLNNHFKHEIPAMVKSINSIETTVKEIQKEQILQGNRITRVEVMTEVL